MSTSLYAFCSANAPGGRRHRERGIALVFLAVFLVLILAFTALGIDIARLAFTATEVQTVADAAARAGARALQASGNLAGTGITGAHVVSGKNAMNGVLAPDADVKVDEGFYDIIANRFECCTGNSTCCAQRGSAPYNAVCRSPVNRDCARPTAVLAMPHTRVTNLLAGVFDYIVAGRLASAAIQGADNEHSTVEKLAVAKVAGPSSGCQTPAGCTNGDWQCYCQHGVAPCLPIAAPSCQFDCSGPQCVLPPLVVSSNSDSAAWTAFDNGANTPNTDAYLHQGPCDDNNQNNNLWPPVSNVGNQINVNNGLSGQGTSPFSLMACLIGQQAMSKKDPTPAPQGCTIDPVTNEINGWGGTVFTIPIFDLDTCTTSMNQSWPLSGFATVQINSVDLKGSPNTVQLQTLKNSTATNQRVGGDCYQTGCSVLMTR